VDGDAASTRDFRETFLDVVQGNVQAFGYMSGFPLAGIPDIEHHGRIEARQFLGNHRCADTFGWPNQVRSRCQSCHAPVEVAPNVIESYAAEA
jgi:hypothetical protein